MENRTLKNIERVEPRFQITSSGVQWFDLGVVFASGTGETFSAAEIQRLILSGQNHTRLRNGKMAVIDADAVQELQEVLLDCAPQQHTAGYRINSTQAGFLEATLRRHGGWRSRSPRTWRERPAQQSGEAQAGLSRRSVIWIRCYGLTRNMASAGCTFARERIRRRARR